MAESRSTGRVYGRVSQLFPVRPRADCDTESLTAALSYVARAKLETTLTDTAAAAKAEGADLAALRRRGGSALQTDGLNDWPDVVMIDGGKGQLSAVMEALRELDLHVRVRFRPPFLGEDALVDQRLLLLFSPHLLALQKLIL